MDIFRRLEEVVLINSFTKNKSGVDRVGRVFKGWFEELGFETEVFKRELIGDHLLFKSPKKDGRKLLFLGHLDTVFPPGEFEEYKEDSKWVYGPGVCDMKGGIIVMYEALKKVKEKKDIKNVDILLVSDEESGSDDSKYLTKELAKDYDICFVFEAAGKNMELVNARKGIGTFFVDIVGRASHSGVEFSKGIDANKEAAYKLLELSKLTDLKKGTTLNVGKIEGGIGANTISPKAKLTFEIRYEDLHEKNRLLENIHKIVEKSFVDGTKSTLSGSIQRDVMQPSKNQEELLADLQSIWDQKILTQKRGGVSDANITSSSGLTTLDGFGPFGDGDHTIKERALKSSFFERIELVSRFILKKFYK